MGKIKPFGLIEGTTLNGYRIEKSLDTGWTAEAYYVREVGSFAKRVMKIFENYEDKQNIANQRRVAILAKYLEMVSQFGITPRYYHMGHVFLNDGLGHWYIVLELICGTPLKQAKCTKQAGKTFLKQLNQLHQKTGYILGDWDETNLYVDNSGRVIHIDPDFGTNKKYEPEPVPRSKSEIIKDYDTAESTIDLHLR